MKSFPQVTVNAKVSIERKNTYKDDPVVAKAISDVEEMFKGNGRVVIRPSGTEPLVRVMIEGDNQELIEG